MLTRKHDFYTNQDIWSLDFFYFDGIMLDSPAHSEISLV